MSRKVMCILVSLVLALFLIPGAAGAVGYDAPLASAGGVYGYSHGYDGELDITVIPGGGQTQDPAYQRLVYNAHMANVEIGLLVLYCQLTPWNDVEWLLAQVDCIVGDICRQASAIGARVICEYTEYYIDGQYVLIDPIRVVRL